MKTNDTPKIPSKDYLNMGLNELNELDQDTHRALALKIMTMKHKHLKSIRNNVSFFFWLTIIFLIIVFITIVTQDVRF